MNMLGQYLHQNTVLVLSGPTAVGKTGLALALAQRLQTSIISADSRQCYQRMAIGTAQPSAAELAAVKHYYVAAFPVTHTQDAASFEGLALSYLDEIFNTSRIAIVCGGTGLYLKALCDGIDAMPVVDEAVKAAVEANYKEFGLPWLQEALAKEDPAFRRELENPARLLRALIFVRSTGKSITSYQSGQKKIRPFRILKIALDMPRETLYRRINERVDLMMAAGLLEEVHQLMPYRHLPALNTVGYSELFAYLDGQMTLIEAVEKIKQHTRNYAKRQLTWLRRESDVHWVQANELAETRILEQMKTVLELAN
ncbi:MAG: tRNA (adenosine(37)-N6)-dimethylallyltransferase MiaA [Bacteroidetes bacterium]|nr:tRNA (adenosine(37)-N6)-dimethylallyltransferase MiaA [Bacteroidota bacterium]